jgi:hypothetical protein
VLLAAVAAVVVLRHDRRPTHNVTFADSIEVGEEANTDGYDLPGVISISGLVAIIPTAPITLLDVQPYRVTPGVELLAVRAVFQGFGEFSPSGHRQFTGAPGATCYTGPWPPTGYGPSYPVQGLRLAKGDPVRLVFYSRGPDRVGDHVLTGYRITYRTLRGKKRTITGDIPHAAMRYRTQADLVGKDGVCGPRPDQGFAKAWPGFPN